MNKRVSNPPPPKLKETPMKEIELGCKAKDLVSGMTGIVNGRCEYLNGCVQFSLKPQKLTETGTPVEAEWVDIQQLVRTGDGVRKKLFGDTPSERTGGPVPSHAPRL